MKCLIQRVARASVAVDGATVASIGPGFLVLLGVAGGDNADNARYLAGRTASLRIFQDDAGKMNRSLVDTGGAALVVSQFTLCADTSGGNRPSFTGAAPPALAEELYGIYVVELRKLLGAERVTTGIFRAHMQVELVNDGPVTIELASRE